MLRITALLALVAAAIAMPTGGTDTDPACPGAPGGGSPGGGAPGGGAPGGGAPGGGSPGGGSGTPADVCPDGLYSQAQCCATDVLGAVGLNCAVRKYFPFRSIVLALLIAL